MISWYFDLIHKQISLLLNNQNFTKKSIQKYIQLTKHIHEKIFISNSLVLLSGKKHFGFIYLCELNKMNNQILLYVLKYFFCLQISRV